MRIKEGREETGGQSSDWSLNRFQSARSVLYFVKLFFFLAEINVADQHVNEELAAGEPSWADPQDQVKCSLELKILLINSVDNLK